MNILITGAGRGGTNLLTEIVRASGNFSFTRKVEDRDFFKYDVLPYSYCTKLATENPSFDLLDNINIFDKYPELYVIFSIRHPVSTCMSKIVRGSSDGTVDSSIKAVHRMFSIYNKLVSFDKDRVFHIKMEDIIENISLEVDKLCLFLGIKKNKSMLTPQKFNRNKFHKKRYGDKLDKSQIYIYRDWKTSYNGFFVDRERDIDNIKKGVSEVIEFFGYEL